MIEAETKIGRSIVERIGPGVTGKWLESVRKPALNLHLKRVVIGASLIATPLHAQKSRVRTRQPAQTDQLPSQRADVRRANGLRSTKRSFNRNGPLICAWQFQIGIESGDERKRWIRKRRWNV